MSKKNPASPDPLARPDGRLKITFEPTNPKAKSQEIPTKLYRGWRYFTTSIPARAALEFLLSGVFSIVCVFFSRGTVWCIEWLQANIPLNNPETVGLITTSILLMADISAITIFGLAALASVIPFLKEVWHLAIANPARD